MIDLLLSRLKKVKATRRDSWLACCPAHDDKNPSMGIKLESDGRILMYCRAGCSTESILDSIGMEFKDLFPERLSNETGFKPVREHFSPRDLLYLIQQEARIVCIAAIDLKNGKPLNEVDHKRLITAMERINEVVNHAG